MLGFTFLAVQVLIWQSQDISVDIVSDSDEGESEVTISVKNTAGTVLLFHENTEMTGKIEYLSDDGWVEYCEVYYTQGNANAVSQQYNGTFAELEPGEDWEITVPREKVAKMKNGTYRIKMAYVTENKYKKYLEALNEGSTDNSSEDESDESELIPEDFVSGFEDESGVSADLNVSFNEESDSNSEESATEEFYASSVSELFVKTFEYTAPKYFVSAISFDESNVKGDGFELDPYAARTRINEETIY